MAKLTKLACSIGAAIALSHGGSAFAAVPANTGFAEAILNVNNFQIRVGNQGPTRSNALLGVDGVGAIPDFNCDGSIAGDCDIRLLTVNSNGDTTSVLNGVDDVKSTSGVVGTSFAITSYVGANGEPIDFGTPGAPSPGPTANYSAGASISIGNALVTQDNVIVHSVGSLISTGEASGQANQGLKSTTFDILAIREIWLEVSFDASGFLRAALGQDGINADANFSWSLVIDDITPGSTATEFVNWVPTGSVDSVTGTCDDPAGTAADLCREFERGGFIPDDPLTVADEETDGYSIQGNASTGLTDDVIKTGSGGYQLEALFRQGRRYRLTLTHTTISDVSIETVPEPGTLALLGAGLVGIAARRRSKLV